MMHIKNAVLQAFVTFIDVLGGEEQNLYIRLALYCFHWGTNCVRKVRSKTSGPSPVLNTTAGSPREPEEAAESCTDAAMHEKHVVNEAAEQ